MDEIEDQPNDKAKPEKLSIRLILYLTATAAAAWACYLSFGRLAAFDAVIASGLLASISRIPGLWPFRERLGVVDMVTIVVVCMILHGLQIPTISTQ